MAIQTAKRLTFHQDPNFKGGETLVLSDKQIEVHVRAFGLKKDLAFSLMDLSPSFERIERRLYTLSVVPVVSTLLVWAAIIWLRHDNSIPIEVAMLFGVVVTAGMVWYAVRGWRPIEVTIFRDLSGTVLLEIFKPRRGVRAYEDFVAELNGRIRDEQKRTDLPASRLGP